MFLEIFSFATVTHGVVTFLLKSTGREKRGKKRKRRNKRRRKWRRRKKRRGKKKERNITGMLCKGNMC